MNDVITFPDQFYEKQIQQQVSACVAARILQGKKVVVDAVTCHCQVKGKGSGLYFMGAHIKIKWSLFCYFSQKYTEKNIIDEAKMYNCIKDTLTLNFSAHLCEHQICF